MTVASTTSRRSYVGNGSTLAFAADFYFQDESDIEVALFTPATGASVVQVLGTDYTISGTADPTFGYTTGGTVNMLLAPAATEILVIYRSVPPLQGLDLPTSGPFPSQSVEAELDNTALIAQRAFDKLSRAMVLPDGFGSTFDPTIPAEVALSGNEGRCLVINADGDGFEVGPVVTGPNVGAGTWGSIGGTLSSQTDLQSALDAKANLATANTTYALAATVGSDALQNLGLAASVATSILTVRLKQADGTTDPAGTTGQVRIAFRDSTLANGKYVSRSVTSALSMTTVAIGASLGLVSGQNQYIYVYAIDNAGTVELALAGSRAFDEGTRYSTTAIGAGSTSSAVLYSTTARSNVAIRLIGRLLVNEVTAGTYASAPTEISLVPLNVTSQIRSEVYVDTGNGFGSTNTKIRRFTNTRKNVGTAITYADSGTLGGSFTINEDGLYAIVYGDGSSVAVTNAISVNTSAPTTSADTLTYAQGFRGADVSSAGNAGQCSMILFLSAGDVVRAHGDAGGTPLTTKNVMMSVTKIGH